MHLLLFPIIEKNYLMGDIVKCCGLSVPFSKQILSIFLHNFTIAVELHFSQKNKVLRSPISTDLKLIHIETLAV